MHYWKLQLSYFFSLWHLPLRIKLTYYNKFKILYRLAYNISNFAIINENCIQFCSYLLLELQRSKPKKGDLLPMTLPKMQMRQFPELPGGHSGSTYRRVLKAALERRNGPFAWLASCAERWQRASSWTGRRSAPIKSQLLCRRPVSISDFGWRRARSASLHCMPIWFWRSRPRCFRCGH